MGQDFSNNSKTFTYSQDSYEKWLSGFAKASGSEVKNNSIQFAPGIGGGFSRCFFLEPGFTALVNNYHLDDDFIFNREPTEHFGVIIYMYHFQAKEIIEFTTDNVLKNLEIGSHYSFRVSNSQSTHQLKFRHSTVIRGVSIYLEKDWIEKNTSQPISAVFEYLKVVNNFEQFLNVKQKRLMEEMVNLPIDHPYPDVFIKSRIYRILDKLLESFLQRDISESPEKIVEDDFAMLQKIENILTQSYEAFPGIEKLSRISLMSESKLKKLFKQAFGMGLYEYYQKNRMHNAREQILSGKYSISEVGIKLGYQNLSNFSSAFRKEFQCLPSQIEIP